MSTLNSPRRKAHAQGIRFPFETEVIELGALGCLGSLGL